MELTDGQKVLLIGGISVVAMLSGYFFIYKPYFADKQGDQSGSDGDSSADDTNATAGANSGNSNEIPKQSSSSASAKGSFSGHQGLPTDLYPLTPGKKGPNVTRLQKAINHFYTNYPENRVDEDGNLGPKTWAIVQKLYGVTKKTIVPKDLTYLEGTVKQPAKKIVKK